MKKSLTLLALSLATLLGASACANPADAGQPGASAAPKVEVSALEADPSIVSMVPEEMKKRGTITVGVNPDVPPIKFVDEDGKITGLAPQLVEAAAQVMGLKTEMQLTAFDALIPGLDSDRIDMVASIGDFKERQEKADFIDYLNASTGILASTGFKSDKVSSLMDLCGTRLGYVKGTQQQGLVKAASEECAAAGKPAMVDAGYKDAAASILAVKSGQADGTWIDSPAVLFNATQDPAAFKAIYTAPKPILYGMAFSKNDEQFQQAFKAALVKVVSTGEYEKLLSGYGLQDLALPELPINGGGPANG